MSKARLDAVLASGALAVAGLEGGQGARRVVGGEAGDAVAIGVGEGQLRAGVGAFLPGDDAHPGGPVAEVEQGGDLRDPSPVAQVPPVPWSVNARIGWKPKPRL